MKKTKIIVPALAVLLLSTAASVSGTVAWFSMNNSVKVDGMTVTTRVSSNLLIAETNLEENYTDAINQSREGILEPASTVDGKNFFYTVNAKGDGDAKAENYPAYSEAVRSDLDNPATVAVENNYSNALGTDDAASTGKSNYDVAFNTAYGFNSYDASYDSGKGNGECCFGYIDYAFYIKATSAAANQVLYMSKCNLTYSDGATPTPAYGAITKGFAWRVALLTANATANTPADDSTLALKTIIGMDKSLNQNQVNPVDTSGFTNTTPVSSYYLDPQGKQAADGNYSAGTKYYSAPTAAAQAVKTTTTLANIGEAQSAAAQAATGINAGVTQYTRVVVRLWLEGEDISCTSTTYADLTKDWKLTLEFKLGNATDGGNPAVDNGVKLISSNPALDA